jgi:hypothetical protein
MAIKPRKIRSRNIELDETVKEFLLSGNKPERGTPGWDLYVSRFFDRDSIKKAWRKHSEEVMADWITKNPCSKPWGWWEFEAPRHDTGTGAFFEPLPIPRQRIGGQGQMTWEKYPTVVPQFDKGIPSSWAWVDSENPPRFESEAAFLLRHDLLTEPGNRFLIKHPELLEPERITIDD